MEAWDWGYHLSSWWCSATTRLPEPFPPEWWYFPPEPGCCPDLSCCQGPCLGPWSSCSWGLHWCLWSVSPEETLGIMWDEIRRLFWVSPTLHCPGRAELVSFWTVFIRFFILQQEHNFLLRNLLRYLFLLLLMKRGCWILSNKVVEVIHTFVLVSGFIN